MSDAAGDVRSIVLHARAFKFAQALSERCTDTWELSGAEYDEYDDDENHPMQRVGKESIRHGACSVVLKASATISRDYR